MNIRIRHPETGEDFRRYYHLRWSILRQPWKQPEGSEKDEFESSAIHFMAEEGDQITGVCRLHIIKDSTAQIRFMAVHENYRGKGIGKLLLLKAEEAAAERLMSIIILQAREEVVPFYQQNGYEIIEKSFLMYGCIQHFLMEKKL